MPCAAVNRTERKLMKKLYQSSLRGLSRGINSMDHACGLLAEIERRMRMLSANQLRVQHSVAGHPHDAERTL